MSLQVGSRSDAVLALKRGLRNAGYSSFTFESRFYGVGTRRAVRDFQAAHRLTADGVYGPATHNALAPFFDHQAWTLWPPLILEPRFTPTHQTDGLPGYPAIDLFAPGGTRVAIGFDGHVHKLSGHSPTPNTRPGGPYGWSVYVTDPGGNDHFLTHFGAVFAELGANLQAGDLLGFVADYSAATNGVTPSHIHHGRHQA